MQLLIWYVLLGAASLGLGPAAFRNDMNKLGTTLAFIGLVLFAIVARQTLTAVNHVRCTLGDARICMAIAKEAALDAWPQQASVDGWSAQQMAAYRDDGFRRWVMDRTETVAGAQVATQQRCTGETFPTSLEAFQTNCYDRVVVTPGPSMGLAIATPGIPDQQASDRASQMDENWRIASDPVPPQFVAARPAS